MRVGVPKEEEDRVAAFYDQVAVLYDVLFPSVHRYADRVKAFLGRVVTDRTRVLDVGCGGGQLTRHLPPSVEVVGLDVSERMLQTARAGRPGGRFLRHSYAAPVPADLGTFEVAVAAGCLDFCQDLGAALSNISAALRPGGRLLFSVLERRADLPGHGRPRLVLEDAEPQVTLCFWSREETEEALQRAGLVIIEPVHAPAFDIEAEGLQLSYRWWEVARG